MAVAAVQTYGLPVQIDPHQALVDELARTYGHVLWLGREVAKLSAGEGGLYGPVGGGKDSHPRAEPHVYVRLYQAERDHYAKVAKTCVDVGIAEREIRLAEDQGKRMAAIVDGILTELGVRDRPEVPAIVRKHFTLVAGGAA